MDDNDDTAGQLPPTPPSDTEDTFMDDSAPQDAAMHDSLPVTPPSSPLRAPVPHHLAFTPPPAIPQPARYLTHSTNGHGGRPQTPPSPMSPGSPTSAMSVSASAVSATEQPRYNFPEVSASIDATPTARYLGRAGGGGLAYGNAGDANDGEDDVEAELRRMAQRQLPRGDLGRREWRLDTFGGGAGDRGDGDIDQRSRSGAPSSPTSSIRSAASSRYSQQSRHHRDDDPALPRPPASPPSSPRSRSNTSTVSAMGRHGAPDDFSRPPAAAGDQNADENFNGAVVWGTNISVAESMGLFRTFLHQFRRTGQTISEEPYYLKVLRHMAATQSTIFNLDTQHLLQHRPSRKVYNQLVLFPQVLIRILDMVVNEEFGKLAPDAAAAEQDADSESQIQVRPFNLSDLSPMRNLNPSDIDQLVCLKGMVTRCSAIIPDLKEAFFRCTICRHTAQVELDRGRIEEPTFCENCNTRHCMEMIHNRCAFTDKQLVKMQETPDAIPEGETPYTVMLFAFDDLVDDVRPGDKVEVTGIYRAVPMRASSRQRVVKSVFKTYIDVVHFRRVDELARRGAEGAAAAATATESETNTMDDANRIHSTEEIKLTEFRRIAAHPNVYQNLAFSLAPSIWELDDVKKGILCMLFGGTRKDADSAAAIADGDHNTDPEGAIRPPKKATRSDMNVLLCGDPGTSKSQLLSYVHKLSPRSIYTSGKGSSAVGLTASIIRDMETGDLVLESGALVLSDEGICCIDEFDKMSESARSVLHEVMEQQTVSIAKAGIICSLNARASILASANPIESRYNPNKSVIENVNILPTLLSRFDLIYLILDKPLAETDRQLAKHIVALYFDEETRRQRQEANVSDIEPISMKLLTEYIAYAKKNVHPRLTSGARHGLIQAYLELRRLGSSHAAKKNITATPRQLESLIRIAEALAKMKLSAWVHESDVAEALRLMNVATQRAAMDPRTGTIDMDMINTGHSSLERESIARLVDDMKQTLSDAPNQSLGVGEMRKLLEDKHKSEIKGTEFQLAMRAMEDEDLIQVSHGIVRYFGPAATS